jgi:asparagine synthase (glutamine-hydrolysing)
VAKRYDALHITRRVSEREFREDLPAIIEAMDQPSIDGVNTSFVAKAAKEAGLKSRCPGLVATSYWPDIRALWICRTGRALSVQLPPF